MKAEDLMTVNQAAVVLDVHPQSIREALKEGRLPFQKVLGVIAISAADVEEYRRRTRPDGVKPRGRPKKSGT